MKVNLGDACVCGWQLPQNLLLSVPRGAPPPPSHVVVVLVCPECAAEYRLDGTGPRMLREEQEH